MNLTQIINWPHTKNNNMAPLWAIVLRIAVLPVMYAGVGLVFVSLLIGWGPYEARRFWRNW